MNYKMWRYHPGVYRVWRLIERLIEWLSANRLIIGLAIAFVIFGSLAVGAAMDTEYEAHSAAMAAWIENPGNAGMK